MGVVDPNSSTPSQSLRVFHVSRQVSRHPVFQEPHKSGIHEAEFVWNIEADDPLRSKSGAVARLQLGAVLLLHDNDQIRPVDKVRAQGSLGITICPGGRDLKVTSLRKHLFCRGAAETISAADEQNVLHGSASP